MKMFWKHAAALVLIIFMIGMFGISAAAQEEEKRVVRVGMAESPYFVIKQQDGTYSGYLGDYLRDISKYTSWEIEYVDGSINELVTKLIHGDIDIMGGMMKNDATRESLDFADVGSGYLYATLTTWADNEAYVFGDYDAFSGMKVGISNQKGNRAENFHAFCESNGIDVELVQFENAQDLQKALDSRTVDAIVSNDTSRKEGEKIIARFNVTPYFFAVSKGKTDVLRELNFALSKIFESNPRHDDLLYEKYFGNTNDKLELRKAEKEYIQKVPSLKAVVVDQMKPVEYYDKAAEHAQGIAPEILKLLGKKTGLTFEIIRADSLKEAKQMIADGRADLITGYSDSLKAQEELNVVFTVPYLHSQSVRIQSAKTGSKEEEDLVMAVPDGYPYAADGRMIKSIRYPDVETCLRAVTSGAADYAVFNSLLMERFDYLRNNKKITITPLTNRTDQLCIGIAAPADPVLMGLMDKAIYSLTQAEIDHVVYQGILDSNGTLSMQDLIYAYPVQCVFVLLLLLMILGIAIIMILKIMHMRIKLAHQTALKGESYRIIGELTKEFIFTYEFDTQELMVTDEFAALVQCKPFQHRSEIEESNDEISKKLILIFNMQDGGEGIVQDFSWMHPDGVEQWYRAVATVLLDEQKKPIRGIGKISSIENDVREKKILENNANQDFLTGLYNRRHFEQLIVGNTKDGMFCSKGTLWVMDIDYFKSVNDELGHSAGDCVLCKFAETLKEVFTGEDIKGRWGGDEFIVYACSAVSEEEASGMAKRLCTAMDVDYAYEGKTHHLSISVGIALIQEGISYKTAFEHADAGLYEVKHKGRNGFAIVH